MGLPPLNALRAFEAAARHGGFIAAAEELFVTRGAISRQVKLLEDHLGVALFKRNHRGVELTAAGQRLLPVLSEAFGRIALETARLSYGGTALRIICPPALSIRWLFPRLDQFRQRHPDIRVHLTTDFYGDRGFDGTEYDLGLSFEHVPGRTSDIMTEPLFPFHLSPACAPDLCRRIAKPRDLADCTLLHDSQTHAEWGTWVRAFQEADIDPTKGEVFPNHDMAVKAALMGKGVVMADMVLGSEELASGALLLPFPDLVCGTDRGRFALIGPSDRWHDPKVRAFREWIGEAAKHPDSKPFLVGAARNEN